MTHVIAPSPAAGVSPGAAPTFSVSIAAFNSASVVSDAVASALGQTAPPLEVIVCDDGSTDELDAALAPFHGRITLLRQSNGGAASAHNRVLARATGDFIAVLDADDAWEPERLARLTQLAVERPDLDVLATDATFEVDGRETGHFYDKNPFPVDDQRRGMLEGCFVWNPAVRRRRLLAIGGWDEQFRIAYDWDCWRRLVFDGASAGLVREPLARYRLHAGSLSADRRPSLWERVSCLEKARGESLTEAERRVLDASLRTHRRRAFDAELDAAGALPAGAARLRLLRLAAMRRAPRRGRLSALVRAGAPGKH